MLLSIDLPCHHTIQYSVQHYPLPTTRRRVENQPPNLTKHQILQPQYAKGSDAPLLYTPTIENRLGYSIFLPDNSLRYQRLTSTRLRSGIGRKDTVKTTTTTLPPPTA